MGLLIEGTPLTWKAIKEKADHVRKHGIAQFVNQYNNSKDRQNDPFRWGDEVEYLLVKFNHEEGTCQLLLRGSELLDILQETEINSHGNVATHWRPEYSECMLESSPGKPFGDQLSDLCLVEASMNLRREEVKELLSPDEVLMSLTSFPRMGCPNFMYPPPTVINCPHPRDSLLYTMFYSEAAIIAPHPRFRYIATNMAERRRAKLAINIPMFKDKNTLSPYDEDVPQNGHAEHVMNGAKPGHIFMDSVSFGSTCCCLQTTMQARDIEEAFIMYDNLVNVCPVMLALSVAAPIFQGYLADFDSRWSVISQASDDRTKEERGLEPLKNDRFLINKSRYDSLDSYLSEMGRPYNDLDLVYDKEIYQHLRDEDVHDLLAKHIAHLFIRDPISLFSEKIHQDDSTSVDHFETIQSTNWQTLRFKPPPPGGNMGWRVEFRPMEVQLSDFENAAYAVFIVLVTRAILTFKLNFIIPISKVDENMETAQKKDAVREQKFYFRKDVLTADSPPEISDCVVSSEINDEWTDKEYRPMSADEIINGSDDFLGLIPIVMKYLEYSQCDDETKFKLEQYLQLISNRASGKLMTTAHWIRAFVLNHEDYKQDSVVSESISHDLLAECEKVASGKKTCPELFSRYSTRTKKKISVAGPKAETNGNGKISNFALDSSF